MKNNDALKVLHFIPAWSLGGAEYVINRLTESQYSCSQIITMRMYQNAPVHPLLRLIRNGKISRYSDFLKAVRAFSPQVIHGHLPSSILFLLISLLFFRKIRIIFTIHSEYQLPVKPLHRLLERKLFKSKRITKVAVSDFVKNSILKFYNSHIHVIHNGVSLPSPHSLKKNSDIKNTSKSTAPVRLITVSRIVPVKNLTLMINSVNKISETREISLHILGDDPSSDKSELKNLQSISGTAIHFHGAVQYPQDQLKQADAFCITSFSEGMPVAAMEAMSLGVPVLTTNAGGIGELVINNHNGLISNEFTIEEYSHILLKFIDMDDSSRSEMSNNAADTVQKSFSSSEMLNAYFKLYHNGY
jgi:L-malate glycosyltransferase